MKFKEFENVRTLVKKEDVEIGSLGTIIDVLENPEGYIVEFCGDADFEPWATKTYRPDEIEIAKKAGKGGTKKSAKSADEPCKSTSSNVLRCLEPGAKKDNRRRMELQSLFLRSNKPFGVSASTNPMKPAKQAPMTKDFSMFNKD